MNGLSKSKDYLCGVHRFRVKFNLVLCVQCGRWVNSNRYAGVERVTSSF